MSYWDYDEPVWEPSEADELFDEMKSKLVEAAKASLKNDMEKDVEAKNAAIKLLEASILRRETLLANENYVNKAPAKIVELDRQKLEEEKKKLEELKR